MAVLAIAITACGADPAPIAEPSTVTAMSTVMATTQVEVPTTVLETETETETVVTTKDKPVPTTVKQTVVKTVPTTKTKVETETKTLDPGDLGGKTFTDGTYLVGSEIAPGNYKCSDGDDSTFFSAETKDGDIVENGFTTVAIVPAEAFTIQFSRCAGDWKKVG